MSRTKVSRLFRKFKTIDVKFLPPSINISNQDFTIDEDGIRFGLVAVKHLGEVGINEIIAKRPFISYEELKNVYPNASVIHKHVKHLISIGAFDEFSKRDEW